MEWEDTAIILNSERYNDDIDILSIFTKTHGLRKAAFRKSKQNQNFISIGNIVSVLWKGRLDAHLGRLMIKAVESIYPYIYTDKLKIMSLNSISAIFLASLQERDKQTELFGYFEDFLYALKYNSSDWLRRLIFLEMQNLDASGFGLDLGRCALTNSTEDLAYISPTTGKAVNLHAAGEYKDRLFKLCPVFISPELDITHEESAEALKILRHFINKNIFKPKYINFPQIRLQLEAVLQNHLEDAKLS